MVALHRKARDVHEDLAFNGFRTLVLAQVRYASSDSVTLTPVLIKVDYVGLTGRSKTDRVRVKHPVRERSGCLACPNEKRPV